LKNPAFLAGFSYIAPAYIEDGLSASITQGGKNSIESIGMAFSRYAKPYPCPSLRADQNRTSSFVVNAANLRLERI
jgi:hypothetical protein